MVSTGDGSRQEKSLDEDDTQYYSAMLDEEDIEATVTDRDPNTRDFMIIIKIKLPRETKENIVIFSMIYLMKNVL